MEYHGLIMPDNAHYIPLVVIGTISSSLSVLGSSCIIYMASRETSKIMHRLLLLLSYADLVASLCNILTSYLIPSEVPLPGASGTFATCSAIGFFFTTHVIIAATYNFYLSGYYFLMVRRSWREWDFKPKMEIPCHVFAFVAPLSIGVLTVATQSYNSNPLIVNLCTWGTYPWECHLSDLECTRSNHDIFGLIISLAGLLYTAVTVLGFVCTGMVACKVRNTLRRSQRYNFGGGDAAGGSGGGPMTEQAQSMVKEAKTQAMLYSLVYFNTVFWPSMQIVFANQMTAQMKENFANGGGDVIPQHTFYFVQVLYWMFYPLQGVLNFLVYTRQKVKRWREAEPEAKLFFIYSQIIQNRPAPPMLRSRRNLNVEHTNKGEHQHRYLEHLAKTGSKQHSEGKEDEIQNSETAHTGSSRTYQLSPRDGEDVTEEMFDAAVPYPAIITRASDDAHDTEETMTPNEAGKPLPAAPMPSSLFKSSALTSSVSDLDNTMDQSVDADASHQETEPPSEVVGVGNHDTELPVCAPLHSAASATSAGDFSTVALSSTVDVDSIVES